MKKYGILTEKEIRKLCRRDPPLISPCFERGGFPSRGLSFCGYDITLGSRFVELQGRQVLDPCGLVEAASVEVDGGGVYELAPHSVVLAESVEVFHLPRDVFGLVFGKSTWARLGLLVNATPMEPGWHGRLTLELANLTGARIRLYPGRGIAQAVFFRVGRTRGYRGRYQGQTGIRFPTEVCDVRAG
ncbi:MAG: dCTP deaminase [Thermofilaceae archaeon]